MTYKHLVGWAMPVLNDGDIIEDSNLATFIFPTDKTIYVNHSIVLGRKEDMPSNIIFDDRCVFVLPDTSEPEPVQDVELAAKAELVLQSLIASGKLSPEMITVLNGLLGGVKATANVLDIEVGQAATLQTLEIIDRLKQGNNLELASQIEQALAGVQSIWEAK
jgi:hypothetical protein